MAAWGRATIAAALAVCAMPPPTATAAKHEVQPPTASALIYLPKSHGYNPAFVIPNERVAGFYINQDFDAGFSYAAYLVNRRRSDPSRLSFALGSLGHVSLRFFPSGRRRVHRLKKGCRGRPAVTLQGQFRGRVKFRGEGGYVRVFTTRAEGEIERSFRLVCRSGKAYEQYSGRSLREYWPLPTERGELAVNLKLLALAKTGGRTVELQAKQLFESEGAEFVAATEEWVGKMLVGRAAFANDDSADALTATGPGQHPSGATIRPPAPFSGEASFFETSQTSHSWTGSLAVSYPGLELPLTGPEFATSLCALDLSESPYGCDAYEPKPVVPARPFVQGPTAPR